MLKCLCDKEFKLIEEFKKHFMSCGIIGKYLIEKQNIIDGSRNRILLRDFYLKEGLYSSDAIQNKDYVICPYCILENIPNRYKVLNKSHFIRHSQIIRKLEEKFPYLIYVKKEKLFSVLMERKDIKVVKIVKSDYPEIKLARDKTLKIRVETNLRDHNIDYIGKKDYVKEKISEYFKDEEKVKKRQQNIEKTNLEKRGVKNVMHDPTVIQKLHNTLEKNYGSGITNPMQIPGVPEKIIKTMIKEYGKPYVLQNSELKERSFNTQKNKRNGKFWHQTLEGKLHIQELWHNKCKDEIERIVQQRKISSLKNWDVEVPSQHPLVKKKIQETISKKNDGEFFENFSISIQGYRPDLDQSFRSSWEANFARYLRYQGISYYYEYKIFDLIIPENIIIKNKQGKEICYKKDNIISYIPDFYTDHFIEIKGNLDDLSKLKIKLFKEQYPKEADNFELILKEQYIKIKKEYSLIIPFWETNKINIKTHPEYFGIKKIHDLLDNTAFCKKEYIKLKTEEEKEKYISKIYDYYRLAGFPFCEYNEKLFINDIKNVLAVKEEINGFKPIKLNQRLFHYFFPHFWNAASKNKLSPFNFWNKDEKLKELIKNRLKYAELISNETMRRGIKILCKAPTNFNSGIAKLIYDKFCPQNSIVYDFCGGWGGRLVGAFCSNKVKKYIANDVSIKTINSLEKLGLWLNTKFPERLLEIELYSKSSHILELEESVDLIFTSPPYFNKEIYSNDKNQSINLFLNYDEWFNNYLLKSVELAIKTLKSNGYLILALSNINKYPIYNDFKEKFKILRFIESIPITYPQTMNKEWVENILVYQKD